MRSFLLAAVLVPFAAGAVFAQSNPIAERKALMDAFGDQTKVGAAMMKGDTPFDAAKAAAIFKTFSEGGAKFGTLFPAGSNSGDTKALPAVWSDRAGFDKELATFNAAVAKGAPTVTTAEGFKAAFAAVAQSCRTCHTAFKAR